MGNVKAKTVRNFDGGTSKSVKVSTPSLNGGSASTPNTSYVGVAADGGSSSGR